MASNQQVKRTDHDVRNTRSGRGGNSQIDYRASQVVSLRNPCKANDIITSKKAQNIVKSHTRIENNKIRTHRIGTWNVRSLFMAGKLDNAVREMHRLKINILGLSEVRWPGSGKCQKNKTTLFYSGNDEINHPNGVGILLDNKTSQAIISFIPLSDRAMLIKLNAQPTNVNIIQCYAPTAEKPDREVETFYKELRELLGYTKNNETTIIMGDFNAKVGNIEVDKIVGKYGLGERNSRGDKLIQFCQEEEFVITNTLFKLPERRLYTWQSPQHRPDSIVRNQIDYVLIKTRFKNGIKGIKTYPGADIGSDHNPVVGNLHVKLKKLRKSNKKSIDMKKLKDKDIQTRAKERINEEFATIKSNTTPDTNTDNVWDQIKHAIVKVEQEEIGYASPKTKKEWMTEEILLMMDNRRVHKHKNIEKYKQFNTQIRMKIRIAKEEWMRERCEEIELLQNKHDSYGVHKKIKEVTHSNKNQPILGILNETNEMITEEQELLKVWQIYIRKTFTSDAPRIYDRNNECEQAPKILKSEILKALKLCKNGKATGPDEIHIEMIKQLEEENLLPLFQLIQQVHTTGNIPKDWLTSVFIPLPKKSKAKKCDEFRLISLMSQVLKILLKIIQARIYHKCEADQSDTQFGFREGMGTREALASLLILFQKCRDMRKDVYVCFIDYEKAFDRVNHTVLLTLLQKKGLDKEDIEFVRNLYWNQEATVRCGQTTSEPVCIEKGVRQGCVLSPILFNMYSDHIFNQAIGDDEDGIKINGRTLNNIRYADDTVIVADNPEALQRLINKVVVVGDQLGMKINVAKTKVMAITRSPNPQLNINIYDTAIEKVEKFKYLGSCITTNVDPDVEVRSRIEQARAIFLKMKNLLCNATLNLNLRYRFVKAYVHSVLLYGTETWTLKVNTMNRLEAFEMWIFRRLLKISWTQHIPNDEVLRRVRRERELLTTIKRRKTAYLGHIYRNNKYDILKLIIEGKIEGKRGPGRRQHSWLKNIRDWTGMNTSTLIRTTQDRNKYAEIVANLH